MIIEDWGDMEYDFEGSRKRRRLEKIDGILSMCEEAMEWKQTESLKSAIRQIGSMLKELKTDIEEKG